MSKSLKILSVSCSIFLLFILFSFLVHKNLFTAFDFNTTIRLQDHMPRRFDFIFSTLSYIGNFQSMLIFLTVVLIIKRKVSGVLAFFFFGFMHVFELYGKTFVDHLPPPHFMLRTQQFNLPEFYVRSENSYPSGHSARAAFVTVFLGMWIWQSKKLSQSTKIILICILVGYDISMFVSRVYLGEHWTTDVIGGILLGTTFAILSYFPLPSLRRMKSTHS